MSLGVLVLLMHVGYISLLGSVVLHDAAIRLYYRRQAKRAKPMRV